MSKLQAMATARCPRCRKGPIFRFPFYKVLKSTATHKECPHCKLRYEIEPGFFWTDMYVSYAQFVAIMVAVGLSIFLLARPASPIGYIVPVFATMLVLYPFIIRVSRVVTIHLFSGVKYQPEEES